MSRARHGPSMAMLAAGVSGFLMVALAAPVQAAEVDLEARLHSASAFPDARGHADYESESSGREFEIVLAGVSTLSGQRLTVRVDGDLLGRMTVDQRGRAHLHRHAGVPAMSAGHAVRVRTTTGRLVASGTLQRDSDD